MVVVIAIVIVIVVVAVIFVVVLILIVYVDHKSRRGGDRDLDLPTTRTTWMARLHGQLP